MVGPRLTTLTGWGAWRPSGIIGRRALSAFLVLTVCALSVPRMAFGVEASTSAYDAADAMRVYGYTDESTTITDLAVGLGVSPRVAAGLAMYVDGWAQGSKATKLGAAELANLAAGAKTTLQSSGEWDSFADYLGGGVQLAAGVLLDFEPWYDSLGFSSLAEAASYPDVTVGGKVYRAGVFSGMPHDLSGALWNTVPGEAAVAAEIMFNPGSAWRTTAVFYTTASVYEIYSPIGSQGIRCSVCGWMNGFTTTYPIVFTLAGIPGKQPSISSLMPAHRLTCQVPSESAVVITSLLTEGAVGRMLLASAAIANPGGAVLGALDTWGIPAVLPPGAIHDSLEFADSWGDDLTGTADGLASVAASMTVDGVTLVERGIGTLLDGVSEALGFVGTFWDRVQAYALWLVQANEDWVRVVMKARIRDLADQFRSLPPFSYIDWLSSMGDLFEQAGG